MKNVLTVLFAILVVAGALYGLIHVVLEKADRNGRLESDKSARGSLQDPFEVDQ